MVAHDGYQLELGALRALAREVGGEHEEIENLLSERRADPAMERLLSGSAALLGRLRQRLESDPPELWKPLLDRLWAEADRPRPSATLVEFGAGKGTQHVHHLPRAARVRTRGEMGEGTFQTTCPTTIYPARLEAVRVERPRPEQRCLVLTFASTQGADWSWGQWDELRIHFRGERATNSSLYSCLTTACMGIEVRDSNDRPIDRLSPRALRPFGLRAEEAILPADAVPPLLRLLEEFFWLPEKFWGISVFGSRRAEVGGPGPTFSISFELERLPEELGQLSHREFLLGAVPAIGARSSHKRVCELSQATALQLRVDGDSIFHSIESIAYFDRRRDEWLGIPAASDGVRSPSGLWYVLDPFRSSEHGPAIVFVDAQGHPRAPEADTATVQMWTFDGAAAKRLPPGQLTIRAPGVPSHLLISNPVEARRGRGLLRGPDATRRLIGLERAPIGWLCSLEGIRSLIAAVADESLAEDAIRRVEVHGGRRLDGYMMKRTLTLDVDIHAGSSRLLGEALLLGRLLEATLRPAVERSCAELVFRCRTAGLVFDLSSR